MNCCWYAILVLAATIGWTTQRSFHRRAKIPASPSNDRKKLGPGTGSNLFGNLTEADLFKQFKIDQLPFLLDVLKPEKSGPDDKEKHDAKFKNEHHKKDKTKTTSPKRKTWPPEVGSKRQEAPSGHKLDSKRNETTPHNHSEESAEHNEEKNKLKKVQSGKQTKADKNSNKNATSSQEKEIVDEKKEIQKQQMPKQGEEQQKSVVSQQPGIRVNIGSQENMNKASEEIAEISKLLGKPLTDANSLSFIKQMLIEKFHGKGDKLGGEGQMEFKGLPEIREALPQSKDEVQADPVKSKVKVEVKKSKPAKETELLQQPKCKDVDPIDKCKYVKDLGLCKAKGAETARQRCEMTCDACNFVAEIPLQAPPPPPPPLPPPPPPPPLPPPPPPPVVPAPYPAPAPPPQVVPVPVPQPAEVVPVPVPAPAPPPVHVPVPAPAPPAEVVPVQVPSPPKVVPVPVPAPQKVVPVPVPSTAEILKVEMSTPDKIVAVPVHPGGKPGQLIDEHGQPTFLDDQGHLIYAVTHRPPTQTPYLFSTVAAKIPVAPHPNPIIYPTVKFIPTAPPLLPSPPPVVVPPVSSPPLAPLAAKIHPKPIVPTVEQLPNAVEPTAPILPTRIDEHGHRVLDTAPHPTIAVDGHGHVLDANGNPAVPMTANEHVHKALETVLTDVNGHPVDEHGDHPGVIEVAKPNVKVDSAGNIIASLAPVSPLVAEVHPHVDEILKPAAEAPKQAASLAAALSIDTSGHSSVSAVVTGPDGKHIVVTAPSSQIVPAVTASEVHIPAPQASPPIAVAAPADPQITHHINLAALPEATEVKAHQVDEHGHHVEVPVEVEEPAKVVVEKHPAKPIVVHKEEPVAALPEVAEVTAGKPVVIHKEEPAVVAQVAALPATVKPVVIHKEGHPTVLPVAAEPVEVHHPMTLPAVAVGDPQIAHLKVPTVKPAEPIIATTEISALVTTKRPVTVIHPASPGQPFAVAHEAEEVKLAVTPITAQVIKVTPTVHVHIDEPTPTLRTVQVVPPPVAAKTVKVVKHVHKVVPVVVTPTVPVLPAIVHPVEKCKNPLDIGIMVDSSSGVKGHWPEMQAYVKAIVDRFAMGAYARIGLIQFDTIAKLPVRLETYNDNEMLKQHISKLLMNPYGKLRLDDALKLANEQLFRTARSGVNRLLLVVLEGKANGDDPTINWSEMLVEPARAIQEAGVEVFAVGVTPKVSQDELRIIATDPDNVHVFMVPTWPQLQNLVEPVAERLCHGTANAVPWQPTPTLVPSMIIRRGKPTGPYGCNVNYAKIGCYNDDQNNPRPLPEQLIQDRDPDIPGFSGIFINYKDWDTYMPRFVCRCANEAIKRNYKTFGIQYFGSCWSGPNAEETYAEDGEADAEMCISFQFSKCQAVNPVCVGKQETNFVYAIDTDMKRSNIPSLQKGRSFIRAKHRKLKKYNKKYKKKAS